MKPESQQSASGSLPGRLAVGGLLAFAATLPHSIALAQGSALLMFAGWIGGGWRAGGFRWRTPWTWPLLLFVLWTAVSSILSYEPLISLDKLRGVSLFAIFFLVFNIVRDSRLTRAVLLTLVVSSLISTLYVFAGKITGRGLEIVALAPGSPVALAGLTPGDVILQASGRRINRAGDLTEAALRGGDEALELFYFRPEIYIHRQLPRPAEGWPDPAGWGITGKPWRNFRAAGFYGWNYFTYADVTQLLGSLMVALALAASGRRRWLWGLAALADSCAIAMTLTRAAWGAFACSTAVMMLRSGKRWLLFATAAAALICLPWALRQMQVSRKISLLQSNEPSANYRLEVWSEGWGLLRSSPRHLLVGVGMDSIKARWESWGMFQGGRIPVGHMHSTPLQLAVERGIPALGLWIWWIAAYMRVLWRRTGTSKSGDPPVERALYLGSLGGMAGFLVSSLVHYNFGDSEVVMVIYLLMGLVAAREGSDSSSSPMCHHDRPLPAPAA